jgi:hypothetical protein
MAVLKKNTIHRQVICHNFQAVNRFGGVSLVVKLFSEATFLGGCTVLALQQFVNYVKI